MNKGLLALNIVLLIGVGILFFLFFNRKENASSVIPTRTDPDPAPQWQHTPVAYFDMDSIEANFVLWKQVQAEVVKREAGINDTINQMKMGFQNYYQKSLESDTTVGNSPVRENDFERRSILSRVGHVKSGPNPGGPPSKAK